MDCYTQASFVSRVFVDVVDHFRRSSFALHAAVASSDPASEEEKPFINENDKTPMSPDWDSAQVNWQMTCTEIAVMDRPLAVWPCGTRFLSTGPLGRMATYKKLQSGNWAQDTIEGDQDDWFGGDWDDVMLTDQNAGRLRLAPNGHLVARCNQHGYLSVWDLNANDATEPEPDDRRHEWGDMVFSADSKRIYVLVLDKGNRVIAFDSKTVKIDQTSPSLDFVPSCIDASLDGKWVAIGAMNSPIVQLLPANDITSAGWPNRCAIDCQPAGISGVSNLRFSPDGSKLAVRHTRPGRVSLWNIHDRSQPHLVVDSRGFGSDGHTDVMCWSADGRLLAVVDSDHVSLWNVSGTPRLVKKLTGDGGTPSSVGMSARGDVIVSSSCNSFSFNIFTPESCESQC